MNKKLFELFGVLAVICMIGFFFVIGKTEAGKSESGSAISHTIENQIETMHLVKGIPDAKEAGSAARLLKLTTLRKEAKAAAGSILAALFALLSCGMLSNTRSRLNTFLSDCMSFLTYFILQLRIVHQMDGKKREKYFCTR